MSRQCSICLLKDKTKLEIDQSLIKGESIQDLSERYGISDQILRRHKAQCLSRQLTTAFKKSDLIKSTGLLNILEGLLVTSNLICAQAYAQEKWQSAISGVNSANGVVNTIARIVLSIKELELEKEKIDTPQRISVSLVDGQDMSNLDQGELEEYRRLLGKIKGEPVRHSGRKEPEPKKKTHYVRRKKNKPLEDEIEMSDYLEDTYDHDMEPEIDIDEPEPEKITYPDCDLNWEAEKRKEARRRGWTYKRKPRKSKGAYSDAVVPGSVRTSRDIGL